MVKSPLLVLANNVSNKPVTQKKIVMDAPDKMNIKCCLHNKYLMSVCIKLNEIETVFILHIQN